MREVLIGDICDTYAGGTPRREQTDFFGGGIPWVKSGEVAQGKITHTEETISAIGMASSSAKWVPSGATLIAMYGATAGAVGQLGIPATTNQAVLALVPKSEFIVPDYLFFVIEDGARRLVRVAQGSGQPNLNAETIRRLRVKIPDLTEQHKIAKILFTWVDALVSQDRLVQAKKTLLDSLTNGMISGVLTPISPGSSRTHQYLQSVTTPLTDRNGTKYPTDRVMAVTKAQGMIPMRDHVRADDISRYKIVPPNAFAYNPMRLNIGSIAKNTYDHDVLVSPDYVVFAPDSDKLDHRYLDHLRRTPVWTKFVENAGNGSVRVRIYYEDLARLTFRLPPLDEQRAIADILDTARLEIALLEKQRDLFERQKRGLMQKLLTGEWRVNLD